MLDRLGDRFRAGLDFRIGPVEGGFQISEGHFTRAQFAAQVTVPVFRLLRHVLVGLLRQTSHRGVFEAADQFGVITGRFNAGILEGFKHDLDLVDRLQDQRHHRR